MQARPRDAAATRGRILDAARELFALRGYHGTSVRQIAARAEVDHALVLRYFGDKERLLTLLLKDDALGSRGARDLADDEETALRELSRMLTTALTDGRLVMQLMLRAEMDGVAPESLLESRDFPMGSLAEWLEGHRHSHIGVDPRAFAMVLGAAGFGLVAAQPLLAAGVGWQDEDPDEVQQRFVAALVGLVADMLGVQPPEDET